MLLLLAALSTAPAATARWSFVEAYQRVEGGDWYMGHDNEVAYLAWGESYVMMSLAAMTRATGDPTWLDELARHADAALAQRDDVRGVSDYRGVSTACWQNTSYQSGGEAYCYVVHSGMVGYPLAEYARLVGVYGLEDELGYDGQTMGDKAAAYVAAAEDVVAAHDDQWRSDGTYVFRPDADFLAYPSVALPLNQSNAMGRLLLVLHELTGDAEYLDKATALAERFEESMDDYRWNYWAGSYQAPGEDVSHAAINVDFATMCASRGLVFDDADMVGVADSFMERVYIDDQTFSSYLGGGATNQSNYLPQVGRWLRLTPWRTGIYTAVRDLYDDLYPPRVASASNLASWGYLAEFEPKHCEHFFYFVDWEDPDPESEGSLRTATAYGANVLATPPAWDQACMTPLSMELSQDVELQQWDGAAYHRVAEIKADSTTRLIPFEPRWGYEYWSGGSLLQFADPLFDGTGIAAWESLGLTGPTILSTPPTEGEPGQAMVYAATGEGDPPFWWSLSDFPTGARIDPATGSLSFTPVADGHYSFTVVLDNDSGRTEQSFVFSATAPVVDTGTPDTGTPDTAGEDSGEPEPQDTGEVDQDSGSDPATGGTDGTDGCGCGGSGGAAWLLVLPFALGRRRRDTERDPGPSRVPAAGTPRER